MGHACPAFFLGVSCSPCYKEVSDIHSDMKKRGCTITSEYLRPCDDTYIVTCTTRHGLNVSYIIPYWSEVYPTLVSDNDVVSIATSTGLCEECTDMTGTFVRLTDQGKSVGLYPVLVTIAQALTDKGIPATVGSCCPNWGEIKTPVSLCSNGFFYVNMF